LEERGDSALTKGKRGVTATSKRRAEERRKMGQIRERWKTKDQLSASKIPNQCAPPVKKGKFAKASIVKIGGGVVGGKRTLSAGGRNPE